MRKYVLLAALTSASIFCNAQDNFSNFNVLKSSYSVPNSKNKKPLSDKQQAWMALKIGGVMTVVALAIGINANETWSVVAGLLLLGGVVNMALGLIGLMTLNTSHNPPFSMSIGLEKSLAPGVIVQSFPAVGIRYRFK